MKITYGTFPYLKSAIIIIMFFGSLVYSQEKEVTFERSILFSFKAGYHTGYKLNSDKGFPDGAIFGGSAEFGLNKIFLIGVELDYWQKK